MSKRILWKDAWQAITHSFGRFVAIFLLMAVSALALIGLKITGPDMRKSATSFFAQHQLADLTVTSNYGLDSQDQKIIRQQNGVKKVDFGYLQDETIKQTGQALRIFSKTNGVSGWQTVSGHLPRSDQEIAISYLLKDQYRLGQWITLKQAGSLKYRRFKIVGFVRSSEYLDRSDIGQTTVEMGQLSGVALVKKTAFKSSSTYAIARIVYTRAARLNPYSTRYRNFVETKQNQLKKLLDQSGQTKYQALQNQLSMAEQRLQAAKNQLVVAQQMGMTTDANPSLQLEQQTAALAQKRSQLKQLGQPSYIINDRTSNPGYAIFQSNAERVDILANVFPVLLFAIAALVSLTTMTRFVEEERIKIGTLKALGYSNLDTAKKFALFSLLSSSLGVAIGAVGGFFVLPKIIFQAYAANSTLSSFQEKFSWPLLLLTWLIAILCTTGAALWALHRDLQAQPAALLLPKPPKGGSRILLEHWHWLWNHFSFNYKVTMRNLFRYKSRALMTIFGVAGCTGLLVMGFGIRDSLSGISNIEYSRIIKYDLVAVQNNAAAAQSKQRLQTVLNDKNVKGHTGVYYQQLTKKAGDDHAVQQISMIVPQNQKSFTDYFAVKNRQTQKTLNLDDHGVVISEKLARLLNAKAGSTIRLKDDAGNWHSMKVSGIMEMYIGHYIVMSPQAYQYIFSQRYQVNAQLITLKKASRLQSLSRQLMQTGGVWGINQNVNNQRTIDNTMGSLNRVMIILIGMAALLALVVIYNLSNINVEERMRELSTIKALGFYDQEVTLYIYRETVILSLIGVLFGYLVGIGLHRFIILSLPPANAMFDPTMTLANFIASALIPAVITAGVAMMMHSKIRNVDMLDALSSVD
ncbi:FtsX-like permease family protein [Limosilactobacillus pulli]|uniref:FtsX-like permease family protein n=2 Tax=Limosilactobacillus TaxID=2742598 RepID=UPI0024BB3867|nr:FtsX-like permease family protein [Limosilactobacillus pulli]